MTLSENERRKLLAKALGTAEWRIEDVLPDTAEVVYSASNMDGNGPTRCYRRTFEISDKGVVTLGEPTEVVERKTYEPIAVMTDFSLGRTVEFSDDGSVIRTGKVFQIGDYPDKEFSLTEAEADAAIAAFTPVDNDLEHKHTILDGKLGKLQSVWRSGKELFGKVAIPKWLHEAHGTDDMGASLAWGIASKRIVGNGLVLHPRVADAQLIAAFSAATEGGSTVMTAATNPDKRTGLVAWLKAQFTAGNRPEGVDEADLDRVEFTDKEPEAPVAPVAPAIAPAPDPAAEARFAALTAENEGLRAGSLKREAEAEFSAALTASKVVPAERASFIAQFVQAATDDAKDSGVACFSADGSLAEGSRLKSLRAGIEARLPHSLTTEQIAVFALPQAGDANPDPEAPTAAGKEPSEKRAARLATFAGIKEAK
jgi:hypothetical protein